LLLNCLEFLLSFEPFSNVTSDLGKADELTGALVTNRVNDNRRPKLGAVFANAPAFGFVFSGLGSG
jgi:hypothetical protein